MPEQSDQTQSQDISENSAQSSESQETKPKSYAVTNLIDIIKKSDDECKIDLAESLNDRLCDSGIDTEQYSVLTLLDDDHSISDFHLDNMFDAMISSSDTPKDIILIIHSDGGRIEPAYMISKTINKLKREKFISIIPRKAKSAATLIAIGSDEIHMGYLSELGPIDPQFRGFPALGFANALHRLAEVAKEIPESSDMLSKYLSKVLDIRDVGYFERINESASQYAERLLGNKNFPGKSAQELASHLVNHYKDHSFVIDADESESLFGNGIVKQNSPEYYAAHSLYSLFKTIKIISRVFKGKDIRIVGQVSKASSIEFYEIQKK